MPKIFCYKSAEGEFAGCSLSGTRQTFDVWMPELFGPRVLPWLDCQDRWRFPLQDCPYSCLGYRNPIIRIHIFLDDFDVLSGALVLNSVSIFTVSWCFSHSMHTVRKLMHRLLDGYTLSLQSHGMIFLGKGMGLAAASTQMNIMQCILPTHLPDESLHDFPLNESWEYASWCDDTAAC